MDKGRINVSVVIPTYNREQFIREAVESVLAQSYRHLEIIVIDDGSTDTTGSILASIADPRIRYIRQRNKGRSNARNVALNLAVGRYIAFLDSDDCYLADKIALQVAYMEAHAEADMVYTSAICIDASGKRLGHTCDATVSGKIYADVAFFLPVKITLSTVMLRREVLDSVGFFDEEMDRFEDTDLWRRIAKQHRIDAIPEPTCKVRMHAQNQPQNQCPVQIFAEINSYVDKVYREDREIDPLILGAGARRLCEYYAAAFFGSEYSTPFGELLLNLGRRLFNPKVSIIIPVYNGANYLAEAIESALSQTYENTEILVINDGSNDCGATEKVAREFAEKIRYLQKPNGGVSTALNLGIEEMTGDYFSWLSHDDLYLPTKLSTQVAELVKMPDPQRYVLYSDYEIFTNNPRKVTSQKLPRVDPSDFRRFITTENKLHGCTLLVPRRAFQEHGGFDPVLRTTQDYDFWFRVARNFRFVHQPIVLIKARSHKEQGTVCLSSLVLEECDALLKGFVEKLSSDEVCCKGIMSEVEGYSLLASNLQLRGFAAASARAYELGKRRSEDPDATTTSWERAVTEEKVAQLIENLQQLCRQRDIAQSSANENRRLLDEIYHSRSWRITAPLRYLSGLLGRNRP